MSDAGVVLCGFHWTRFERAGTAAADAFADFGRNARPGIFSVRWEGERLHTLQLERSRLHDGIGIRVRPSPLPGDAGLIDKPPPDGIYADVRSEGIATLLTSEDGTELYESCVAALLSWNGTDIVCVPRDRPRVLSTSELAVRGAFDVAEAPIARDADVPLLLINAVKGTCAPSTPGRRPFPPEVRAAIDQALERTAFRP